MTAPSPDRVVRIAVVGVAFDVYAHLEEGVDADDVLRLGGLAKAGDVAAGVTQRYRKGVAAAQALSL